MTTKTHLRNKIAFLAFFVFCTLPLTGKDIKPNILWMTSEDNSIEWISCYGSKNAKTPISTNWQRKDSATYTALITERSVPPPDPPGSPECTQSPTGPNPCAAVSRFLHQSAFTTSSCKRPVTSPAIVRKQTTTYADQKVVEPQGLLELFRKGLCRHLELREKGQPFFTVYNIGDSHESRAFGDPKDESVDPEKMILAPYHPDLPEMRNTYAKYSSAISKMDSLVGQAIENLKQDGLYENTIIVYNSDHGGVLARSKRFLYSSGIHCPLIVRIPEKMKHLYPQGKSPGSTIDRIVSFIDMPKTWVSLTGAEMKENFQGRIFLGPNTEPQSQYHFSWRGRADERFDCVRVMRDEQFAYHKNYAPFAPNGQYLAYMHNMKATGAWERHHLAGKTNAVTGRFFEPRPSEEFYDNFKDFHNIDNQIDDPLHQTKIKELKKELRRQQLKYFDSGLMPEEMRNRIIKEKNTTVYAFVRDPKLYPLAQYLDYADLALTRKKKNLKTSPRDLRTRIRSNATGQ